jgi:hypothetical protein
VATYHLEFKSFDGVTKAVHVYCERCRFLGSFWVTPEQHLEGVLRRVQNLEERHVCR